MTRVLFRVATRILSLVTVVAVVILAYPSVQPPPSPLEVPPKPSEPAASTARPPEGLSSLAGVTLVAACGSMGLRWPLRLGGLTTKTCAMHGGKIAEDEDRLERRELGEDHSSNGAKQSKKTVDPPTLQREP